VPPCTVGPRWGRGGDHCAMAGKRLLWSGRERLLSRPAPYFARYAAQPGGILGHRSRRHYEHKEGATQGLLLIGGAGPGRDALSAIVGDMELVVAADSGLDLALSAGLVPELVVGDMDSLSDRTLLDRFEPSRLLIFPREKDETDTEIGLRVMLERGCTDITIAGGGGGRLDHGLGIIALFERENPPSRWLTGKEDIHLVRREAQFMGWGGSTVSVFPVGERAAEMHSEGLKWPLDGLEFRRGFAGISNVAVSDRVRVEVGVGRLLVIRSLWDDVGGGVDQKG
jgi:thiamine pyrophosphokinase